MTFKKHNIPSGKQSGGYVELDGCTGGIVLVNGIKRNPYEDVKVG